MGQNGSKGQSQTGSCNPPVRIILRYLFYTSKEHLSRFPADPVVILFPFRAQIKLHKTPVATIAVALVCLVVYLAQDRNERVVERHAERVCAELTAGALGGVTGQGYGSGSRRATCADAMLHVYYDPDPESHLAWHVEDMRASGETESAERLEAQYRAFAEEAPPLLTARLWHDRSRFDPLGMLTSSFAHASWDHVIFNLIFFFAFAAAVELILGPVLFLGTIAALSFGIGLFDQLVSQLQNDAGPSLGLSGVVMGMLALFIYFLPGTRIRFFFWFMLSVGTIGIPAWLVGLWYIGWDLYEQLSRTQSYVNFVAHLAGAAFGFLIGILVFRARRAWARDIVEEAVDLTQDEPWLTKLNAVLVGPAVAGVLFLVWMFLILGLIWLVQVHWVVILAVAPALAAGLQLYRSRRAERPRREGYVLGMKALAAHNYDQAVEYLTPLAAGNDTRALFALGNFYAGPEGGRRNEAKAVDLLARAAARGHAQAQYRLGIMYADGRGVPANMGKAIECYEKAALGGVAEAANSLGYLYENGVGVPADGEKAIEWYYRAAVGYHKVRQMEDARAMLWHLEGLASKYPAVLGLMRKLKAALIPGA